MAIGSTQFWLRRVWRCCHDEGGMQVAERIAMLVVVLALLGAVALTLLGDGGLVGGSARDTIVAFITGGAGLPDAGAATVDSAGGSLEWAVWA